MRGKHTTQKNATDPTYSAAWTGVSYAPTCKTGKCPNCGRHLHHEGGNHYCPYCDDYVKPHKECSYK